MKLLHQHLDIKKFSGTLLGVEIEAERVPRGLVLPEPRFWDVKDDGSLRDGGAEFVFAGPLDIMSAQCALAQYHQLANFAGGYYHNDRTSVHVHVNVSDLNPVELAYVVLHALDQERRLFAVYGKGREANNYCVPYSWARDMLRETVYRCLKMVELGVFIPLWEDANKYTSINFLTLVQFGTLEFRMAAGTDDVNVLRALVCDVAAIREAGVAAAHRAGSLDYLLGAGLITQESYSMWQALLERPVLNRVEQRYRVLNKRRVLSGNRPAPAGIRRDRVRVVPEEWRVIFDNDLAG